MAQEMEQGMRQEMDNEWAKNDKTAKIAPHGLVLVS